MKFRQAKKIIVGHSTVYKKYRRRRPPYVDTDGRTAYPSLHDIPIIWHALRTFLHHYKRHLKK